MSGFLKSIGKVFKKVVKTVVKVLPYALAAAAVVFTAGAALGLGLPTFTAAVGGVAAKLGLGATLTGALTGSITSAGFGAAIGGVLGGSKGLKMGALTGALTGGLMGAANPATFGIVKGAEGVTTANALRNGGNAFAAAGSKTGLVTGADGITRTALESLPVNPISVTSTPEITPALSKSMTGGTGGFGSAASALQPTAGAPVADVARSAITSAATGAAPAGTSAAGGAGGFMGMLNNNPLLAQSLLGGISNVFGGNEADDRYSAEYKYDKKAAEDAYGGVYSGNSNAFGSVGLPPPPNLQRPVAKRWAWNQQTNRVEEVPA